ncbi:TPA: YjbQ family protein [Candidatus Galligastranaerophilus faecipullorum]|nr:YjbQ family protein [Candidatus Galligastranaerophilus faecipullorum]
MSVRNEKFLLTTRGFNDIIDITRKVSDIVRTGGEKNAVVHIYSPGSTVCVTTLEYEPGLVKDLPDALENIAPVNKVYEHDKQWHDGNGYAHIRASMIGNSITVPLAAGELELGRWQQIVLIDFDNKPRTRSVIVQILS